MVDPVIISSLAGTAVNVISSSKGIINWLRGIGKMPALISEGDTRPPAVVVNFSQDATRAASIQGYAVIGILGSPKQLSSKKITQWAESAAAIIAKLRKLTNSKPLTIILACPVSVAFIIGSLLGHSSEYIVAHWTGSEYVPLDLPDMDTFRRLL